MYPGQRAGCPGVSGSGVSVWDALADHQPDRDARAFMGGTNGGEPRAAGETRPTPRPPDCRV